MKRIDLTGQQFGRLKVQKFAFTNKRYVAHWHCLCSCGTELTVASTHLRTGHTTSCGCYASEKTTLRNKEAATHGMHKSPEFSVWSKIIERCENPNNRKYPIYGGAGVSICAEWRHDFKAFFDHVGPRPDATYSIDRKDGTKGYEPGNVRWATIFEQNNNKRTNVFIEHNGMRQTVAQWARDLGITTRKFHYRLSVGWPTSKVLS